MTCGMCGMCCAGVVLVRVRVLMLVLRVLTANMICERAHMMSHEEIPLR